MRRKGIFRTKLIRPVYERKSGHLIDEFKVWDNIRSVSMFIQALPSIKNVQ